MAVLIFVILRTIAYGIYSLKETGIVSGISVFFLVACVAAIGYMILFGGAGFR